MTRPQPVLTASAVAGVVTAIAAVLGFLGFADAATTIGAEAQAVGSVAVGVIVFGSHLAAAFHARSKVTPISEPHGATGLPLVVDPVVQAAVAIGPYVDGPRHAAPRPQPGPSGT